MRRSPVLAILAIVFAVLAIVVGFASGPSAGHVADLSDYAVSADGRQLVVTAIVPRECSIARTVADESSTSVRVTVTLSCGRSPSAGGAPLVAVPVAVATPLGDRVVLDAHGGAVTRRSP